MKIPIDIRIDLERFGINDPQRWYIRKRIEASQHYVAQRGMTIEQFQDKYARRQVKYLKSMAVAQRKASSLSS